MATSGFLETLITMHSLLMSRNKLQHSFAVFSEIQPLGRRIVSLKDAAVLHLRDFTSDFFSDLLLIVKLPFWLPVTSGSGPLLLRGKQKQQTYYFT